MRRRSVLRVPDLPGWESARVTEWECAPGDAVEFGKVLCEVQLHERRVMDRHVASAGLLQRWFHRLNGRVHTQDGQSTVVVKHGKRALLAAAEEGVFLERVVGVDTPVSVGGVIAGIEVGDSAPAEPTTGGVEADKSDDSPPADFRVSADEIPQIPEEEWEEDG